jgi:hypothetical protein
MVQGSYKALDWWESFQNGHLNAKEITWQEFRSGFCSYHMSARLVKLKKKEFLNLK